MPIIADLITYSTAILICSMDEQSIFELVRWSYEAMEILKFRNHELGLKNKRLSIELELR